MVKTNAIKLEKIPANHHIALRKHFGFKHNKKH